MTKKITSNRLTLVYNLEGTTNFVAWKIRMEAILDDNGMLEYIKKNVAKSPTFNAQGLAQWKKDVAKASRIIFEGVRDHFLESPPERYYVHDVENTDRFV